MQWSFGVSLVSGGRPSYQLPYTAIVFARKHDDPSQVVSSMMTSLLCLIVLLLRCTDKSFRAWQADSRLRCHRRSAGQALAAAAHLQPRYVGRAR